MKPVSIAYLTAESVIGLVSVVGNAMVLIAIYRNQALRTATNCFIGSLALADLLVGIVVGPCAALSFVGLPQNFLGCVFINSIVIVFTQVSIFSLLAIAMERFIAIKYPFAYNKNVTIRRSIIMLIVTWILAFIVGLVPMFGWNKGPPKIMLCYFTNVIGYDYMVYFNFLGFVFTPLVIMFAIYIYIFSIVHQQMIAMEALKITDGRRKSRKFMREIKAAKSLALVLVLFAVCWLPIHVCNCVTLFCSECEIPMPLILSVILLSHANSMFNPLLYAYGNSKFKRAFRKMFCCPVSNDDMDSTEIATHRSRHVVHHEADGGNLFTVEPDTEITYAPDYIRHISNEEIELPIISHVIEKENNLRADSINPVLNERSEMNHAQDLTNEESEMTEYDKSVSVIQNVILIESENLVTNDLESDLESEIACIHNSTNPVLNKQIEMTYTQDYIPQVSTEIKIIDSENNSQPVVQNVNNVEKISTADLATETPCLQDSRWPPPDGEVVHRLQEFVYNKTVRDNSESGSQKLNSRESVYEHLTSDDTNRKVVLKSLPNNVLFICHL